MRVNALSISNLERRPLHQVKTKTEGSFKHHKVQKLDPSWGWEHYLTAALALLTVIPAQAAPQPPTIRIPVSDCQWWAGTGNGIYRVPVPCQWRTASVTEFCPLYAVDGNPPFLMHYRSIMNRNVNGDQFWACTNEGAQHKTNSYLALAAPSINITPDEHPGDWSAEQTFEEFSAACRNVTSYCDGR